jgi:hypothetical protein
VIVGLWEAILESLEVFGVVLDGFEELIASHGLFLKADLLAIAPFGNSWVAEKLLGSWSFGWAQLEQPADDRCKVIGVCHWYPLKVASVDLLEEAL